MKFLRSSWMCGIIGVVAYAGTTIALWHSPKVPAVVRVAKAAMNEAAKPSWEFHSAEVDQLIADLHAQQVTLNERERQLNELAARVRAERQEITLVATNVAQMQAEFDRTVVRVREEEVANLKRLAKMYAAMSPDGAVVILKEMKDDEIVKIFAFMKDTETAPILELLGRQGAAEAKRAAQISERLKVCLSRNPVEKKPS